MQRIQTVTIDSAPKASVPTLQGLNKTLGRIPNIFSSLANSPAALHTLTGIFGALDKGVLNGKPHEAIVLCNTFTNSVNALVQTEVDFPPAPTLA